MCGDPKLEVSTWTALEHHGFWLSFGNRNVYYTIASLVFDNYSVFDQTIGEARAVLL